MKIKLFLPDFRSFVRAKSMGGEVNTHPVFYFETAETLFFYKPIESIIYFVELDKINMPNNLSPDELKAEFDARELPENLYNPLQIIGTIG